MFDWDGIKTSLKKWLYRYRNPLKLLVLISLIHIPFGPKSAPGCNGGHKQCPVVLESILDSILFYLSYPLILTYSFGYCWLKPSMMKTTTAFDKLTLSHCLKVIQTTTTKPTLNSVGSLQNLRVKSFTPCTDRECKRLCEKVQKIFRFYTSSAKSFIT